MGQGLYKEYRRKYYNDSNVRGTIDINRHIQENIPFCGTIAYNTKEYCYDNSITELIRHTIEYIKTTSIGYTILSSDRIVEDCVRVIVSYTPSYNRSERTKIITEIYVRVIILFIRNIQLYKSSASKFFDKKK